MTDASVKTEISQAFERSNDRLEAAYRLHWRELCGYIAKKFGAGPPDPEDVAQAAFAKFAALQNPETVDNPRAFIYRTAHNIALDNLRRKSTQEAHAAEALWATAEDQSDDLSPERVLLARERLRVISATIRQMPKRNARLLLLNRLHGLSFAEIARRSRMSESNVKKIVMKALGQCEAALAARGMPAGQKGKPKS